MNYILDVHTHSIVSGHAYNTIDEMIAKAKEKNLKLLGISEHCFAMPGSCHSFYFSNIPVVKDYKQSKELEVLFGVEGNIILNENGYDLDLFQIDNLYDCVDYVIASLHKCCFPPLSKEENTNAIIKMIQSGKVHILGHLDDKIFPLDYEKIVKAAKEYKVVIELNNSSNKPNSFRTGGKELDLIYLKLCKELKVPIILSSDAHCKEDILNFSCILSTLEEIDFPKKLIINDSVEKFKKYCIERDWSDLDEKFK